MQNPRTRRNRVKKWLRQNALYLILLAIIIASMGVGALVTAVFYQSNTTAGQVSSVVISSDKNTNVSAVSLSTSSETKEQPNENFYFDVPLSDDIQDYIRDLSVKYEVPLELVYAIIEVESSYRANIVSDSDDYGLMQINVVNHDDLTSQLGITNFLDPKQNILGGIYLISGHLKNTDGDIVKALMRYNCGATGAARMWEQGIYSTAYTDKIMTAYAYYIEKAATMR